MSTSRNSSSSSVKNPYDTSSSSFRTQKRYDSDFEYRFSGVRCRCDIPAPCQEAWKEGTLDPGRRFFGCSQYKDPNKKCNFFLWADPSYPDRAREVIGDLKVKLRRKDDEIHNATVDLNFAEKKMLVLNEECVALRKKNEELTTLLKKKEKKLHKLKRLLVIVIVTWMMFSLIK